MVEEEVVGGGESTESGEETEAMLAIRPGAEAARSNLADSNRGYYTTSILNTIY